MVPDSRGDSTRDVWTIGQASFGTLSLVCRTGGDRPASRPRLLNAGDCSPARAGSVDDLKRVAAQCCHSKRRSGVPRDNSAMARRTIGSPAKGGEACAQCGITSLCGGTAGWHRHRSERDTCARSRGVLERSSAWARGRLGGGQMPGAQSRSPADFRSTSRTMRPCASAMKRSIKRCSFKVEARCGAN